MTKRVDRAADAPLFAWGEALRAAQARKRRLVGRGAGIAAGAAAIVATIVFPPAPYLVWNASASAPVGLYMVTAGAAPEAGDMVLARLPPGYRSLAATRHYLPANVPLVKRVAAVAGDEICAFGALISINGMPAAIRKIVDSHGRPMPWWNGCSRLGRDHFLLLMANSRDSFDGRYFGPTGRADLIGTMHPIWTGR